MHQTATNAKQGDLNKMNSKKRALFIVDLPEQSTFFDYGTFYEC